MGGSPRNSACTCFGRGFRWSGVSSKLFGHCPRWERIFYSSAQKGMEILVGLTLYGSPLSRAIRNLWMLKEIVAPYAHVDLAFGPEGTRSASFLALNPRGGVPVLDDDGVVITESLAINLYLAKKFGGAMAPRDVGEDGQMTSWSMWAAIADVQIYALLRTGLDLAGDERMAAATPLIAALRPKLAALEGVIAQHGFLVGGRFTVADLNVAGCLTYLRLNQDLLDDVPHVRAWYTAALARPAALAAWALREGR